MNDFKVDKNDKDIKTYNGFEYSILPDNTIIITGCFYDYEVLIVPNKIENKVVSTIKRNAFGNLKVEKIIIPESISTIDGSPFYGCGYLTTIDVAPDNKTFAAIDNVLFCKTDRRLICFHSLNLRKYIIPNGIQIIGASAFHECWTLNEVEMSDSVKYINENAFGWCTHLKNIILSDKLLEIGNFAFSNCIDLKSIKIPNSVKQIGLHAFWRCLEDLEILVGRNSYAKDYCKENNLRYKYFDDTDWLIVD